MARLMYLISLLAGDFMLVGMEMEIDSSFNSYVF